MMDNYYDQPVIHKAHWNWLVILYFFLGGISSAAYVIASIAQLVGGAGGRRIVRAGHYLALAALMPCPWLLIFDLGRPERFLHMLRVIKLRSPMSLGTWGLVVFGGFCSVSGLIQAAEDGLLQRFGLVSRLLLALPARTINAVGTLPGFFVGGYTGVLLAITAVPLWARQRLLMGPLFLCSALSNGAAAITLALSLVPGTAHQTLRRIERLDLLAMLAELGLLLTLYRRLGPLIGRPLRQGRLGRLFRWGVLGVGLIAPLALQAVDALPGLKPSRWRSGLAATLVLVGGLIFRYLIVVAGRASADDPEATFLLAKNRDS